MTLHSNRPEEMLPASSGSAGAAVASAGVRRAGDWLCLAATPTFAMMALLTNAFGGPDICSAAPGAFLLSGMVPMYLLMSIFHSGPWLKRAAGWRAWQSEKVKNIEA